MEVSTLRKYILSAMLLCAAFLVQTAVLPALGLVGIAPNLILPVVIVMAYKHGVLPAAFFGAGVGVVMDVLFTPGVGLNALGYVLSAAAAHFLSRRFNEGNALFPAALTFAMWLVKNALAMAVLYLNRVDVLLTGRMALLMAANGLLSALVAAGLFYAAGALYTARQTHLGGFR